MPKLIRSWVTSERYRGDLTRQQLREAVAEQAGRTFQRMLIEGGTLGEMGILIDIGRVSRMFSRTYFQVTITWSSSGVGPDFMDKVELDMMGQLEKTMAAAQLAIDGI